MAKPFAPSDPEALPQVRALYEKLLQHRGSRFLFGQQDAYVEGATFKANREENLGKTDFLKSAGVQPAVAGFDLGHLEVPYTAQRDPEFAQLIRGKDRTGGDFEPGVNLDNIDFSFMKKAIRKAYETGSIVTVSWHSVNPLTGGEYGNNRSWGESAIRAVLPGGRLHKRFLCYLEAFVEFNATLLDGSGQPIPYLFRPFHEHNGDWFWWGIDSTENPHDGSAWNGDGGRLNTPEDFAALYRFTVEYLRSRGVHNLLYCISPDRSRMHCEDAGAGYNETLAKRWLEGYPGDDVIDLFGLDDYWDMSDHHAPGEEPENVQPLERFAGSVETLVTLAESHGKPAALTEMGIAGEQVMARAGLPPKSPYTRWLLEAVRRNETTRRLLYGMVWRAGFRGEDADPNAVYQFRPKDIKDFSKGFERIYLYSLHEDFEQFTKEPDVFLVQS